MRNSLAQKSGIGIGLLATGIMLASNNVDAYAQNKNDYKYHDKGAKFKEYSSKSNDLLEEKVFYNAVTKKDERFYVQHLDKNLKDKYKDDLNIAALPFYSTMPMINSKTGNMSCLVSDTMYLFFPIKEESLELKNSHVPDRCDDQIKDIAGVEKGVNYISTSYVKDYFKKLSKDMVLELGSGESYLILTLPKEQQVNGKTNQLYIPLDDEHQWGVNPRTKKLWVFGKMYRGLVETGADKNKASSAMTSGSTGLVSKLGEKDSFSEAVKEAGKKEAKKESKDSTSKSAKPYIILGGDAGKDFLFFEGELGVQYGPLALIANYGKAKDETILDGQTNPSLITGRYADVKEWNQGIKLMGISGEIHPFYNSKISPFIGGGINNWNYTKNKSITMFGRNGQPLDSDSESKANSENSWKAYGGMNFGKNSKFGVIAGYDSKSKEFVGVRYSAKLGRQKK